MSPVSQLTALPTVAHIAVDFLTVDMEGVHGIVKKGRRKSRICNDCSVCVYVISDFTLRVTCASGGHLAMSGDMFGYLQCRDQGDC